MIVVIHNYYSVIHPYFAFVIELLFILVNVTFFCNAIFDFFFLSLYHLFQLVFLHHLSSSTRFFIIWLVFLRSRGSSQYSRYFLQVLYPAHKIIAITVGLQGANYGGRLKYQFILIICSVLREEVLVGFGSWICFVFLLADTIVFNECMLKMKEGIRNIWSLETRKNTLTQTLIITGFAKQERRNRRAALTLFLF